MTALTTRQRDILKVLLETSAPQSTAEIAAQMGLSPRQVSYNLVGVKNWLTQHETELKITPGVGVMLDCSPEQSAALKGLISSGSKLQLVLPAGQRQQLLALILLTGDEPVILQALQHLARVSRATVLKDINAIEAWLAGWDIRLVRKSNFGFMVEAPEFTRQQALAALMWSETPFPNPVMSMSHITGLEFSLKKDAALLPIVRQASHILTGWDTQRVLNPVAYAEEQLGGRFTDDGVLHLTITLAILAGRAQRGYHLQFDETTIAWLKSLPVWTVARILAKKLGWSASYGWQPADIAGVAMQILAAPRSEIWPGDLDRDLRYVALIDRLLDQIALSFKLPELREDRTLRDGLINHVIPACLRQQFSLWYPAALNAADLPEEYELEHSTARRLAEIVEEQTSYKLPEYETNNLALLLRAAYIRMRPYEFRKVIVVCPSGMATAQLLMARLEARFPRLGAVEVVPLRKLNARVAASAELILTTVPLPNELTHQFKVIQVHPLLMPADINAITRFLS